ncbi:MAG: thiol reductant ABC exporter subunit CydC [Methylococcales bacterium]|nr:thiol reductant ABC exporter subunit CydC [Methylococcales bacterium]
MKDLLFFLKLFIPYKKWLIVGIFLAFLTSVASISLLTLSGWFITSSAIAGIMAPDGVAITFNFMQPAAEIRALAIVRTLGRYAERVVTHEATFQVLAEIRCWFFRQLIPLSPGRLAMQRSADLLNGITQDINLLDSLYLRLCSPALVALFGNGAVVIFIGYYSVQISLIVSIMLFMTAVFIPWLFNRLSQHSAKKSVEHSASFKVKQIEILQGIAELSAFNAYERYKTELLIVSEQMLEMQIKNNQLTSLSSAITIFLSLITLLITLVLGSNLFQQGEISGADLAMISFCVLAVFELVTPLSAAIQLLPKTQTAAKRIRAITNLTPVIADPPKATLAPKTGGINIYNLSFRYLDNTDWVLNDINLTIPQGRKIAIVGKSGEGKTTLLQLMMHFYDPQKGSITFGGKNYKEFSFDQFMHQFSVLSQRTHLFSATIKENLLIAKPTASEMEIKQAIKMAGLDNYISNLPEGINSWIGENGAQVSGGEGRRIALARVYLKNTSIILLDEPTEGLDKETEQDVLNTLEKIAQKKTLIMVTHKKAGLRLVDETYEICKGKLVPSG